MQIPFTPRRRCHSRDLSTRFSTMQKSLKNIKIRPNGDHGSAGFFWVGKHRPRAQCDFERKRHPTHRPTRRPATSLVVQSPRQQPCQRVCRTRGCQRLDHRPGRRFRNGSTRLLADTVRACDVHKRSARVARRSCHASYRQRHTHHTSWDEVHNDPPVSQPTCHAPTPLNTAPH